MFINLQECSQMFSNVQQPPPADYETNPTPSLFVSVTSTTGHATVSDDAVQPPKWLYTQIGKIVPCSSGATRPKPLAVSRHWRSCAITSDSCLPMGCSPRSRRMRRFRSGSPATSRARSPRRSTRPRRSCSPKWMSPRSRFHPPMPSTCCWRCPCPCPMIAAIRFRFGRGWALRR